MQENEKKGVSSGNEISLLHYLVVILKHKKLITGVTLACALITAVISLIMPPIYKAETQILPPQASNSGIASQVLSQLGGASGLIGSSLGISSTNDQYIGMLKSRTVYDYIIDRFGLMELYKAKYREDARNTLDNSVTIENGKDEIISLSVEDEDPKRAAEIANAFIEKLKEITQTLAVTEASKRRLFFEEELRKIKENLIKSEEAMKGLQEKTGAISIDEQAKAVIESIADLRAQIAAKEVEIMVMKTYTEPKNPDLQKAQDVLKGMKEQLQAFEAKSGENADPLMPTGRMPQVGTDYTRMLREVKYQETLFALMAQQYEIARVDEARDAIIIQVLDKALPPTKKAKPKRVLMVAIATFTGFFLAIFTAFFMEYMEKTSNDEGTRKMIELVKTYSFLKKKNKTINF
jgi:tyrosine-protein kinase Etk/Wzc